MAPMTTKQSFYNGVVTDEEIKYYADRAKDVGAIITGTAYIQKNGRGWLGELGIDEDNQLPQLTKLADSIKENGAKAILQIFHAGRMTKRSNLEGEQTVSASAVAAERPNAEMPRELTEEEIMEVIHNFGEATKRAIKAGFNGVEIHGANTYLIQQFFSPHSNRREDQWGGSLENRMRFPLMVVDEITKVVKENAMSPFAVGYRISPEEYEEPGIRFSETLQLIDQLADKKLDYLHVSLKKYNQASVSEEYSDKPVLQYVSEKVAGRMPLIGVGGIRSKAEIDGVLEHAEIAAIGQQLIAEPRFIDKVLMDQEPITDNLSDLYRTIDISEALRGFLVQNW